MSDQSKETPAATTDAGGSDSTRAPGSASVCPHCKSGLLWSEDRGAHCDGCDDFDAEEYQRFVESMAENCQCRANNCPCDGVLAGGPCDMIQEEEVHESCDDDDE